MVNTSWSFPGKEWQAAGRIALILAAVGLLISLTGFIHNDPALPLTQSARGVSAAFRISPYPAVQMEETNLQLTLKDENNQPITGARVQLDLSKLDISMPPYFLQANDGGNGVYQVQGSFSLAGNWQIRVDVFVGGRHRQFTYFLDVD
jgi:hypothetical protein